MSALRCSATRFTEHEVVHDGDEDRVILLFDMWHPDLVQGEKLAIQEMFDGARKQGWLR